jgi:hypothetical protein
METFQIINDNGHCQEYYINGKIKKLPDLLEAGKTWKYSPVLETGKHIYAYLYTKGQKLNDTALIRCEQKIRSLLKAATTSKIPIKDFCYSDILGDHISQFCKSRENVMKKILKREKPPEYEILSKIHENATRFSYYKNSTLPGGINYDIFGTKTGRMTTLPGSFPILTLAKKLRKNVLPKNDLFVELDFNGAEARTLLALTGIEQPKYDIHKWNVENLFSSSISRDACKKRFFSWLYNPNSNDRTFESKYDSRGIKLKYFDGSTIKTPFNREIESDEFHAINYLLQSTTSDIFQESVHRIFQLLQNSNSCVAFAVHDSVVLDFSKQDTGLLRGLIKQFSKTRFGEYPCNLSIGKNFLNMEAIESV